MIQQRQQPRRNIKGLFSLLGYICIFLVGLFGIYLVNKKNYAMGGFCIVFVVAIVIFFLLGKRQRKRVPFSVQKQLYIQKMEEQEHISINNFAKVFQMTEESDRYVFVLKQTIDAIPTYFMCEASMYEEGVFGRGFGQWTEKEVEAVYWYQTRKKYDAQQVLAEELQKQAVAHVMIEQKRRLEMENAMQQGRGSDFK